MGMNMLFSKKAKIGFHLDKNEDNDQTIKTDAGKVRPTLVESSLIREVAKVRMYGVAKYGDRENWSKVEVERYRDALYRHWLAYLDGETVDKESGLSHLSHMACNLMFLIKLEERKKEE